jgi:anti-sigma regulatory factor (Ser/Thr protein kinase)
MDGSRSRSMRIDANVERLADVRALVREVALACHAPAVCIDDLVQAVDEAATNIIVHGYRRRPGWIEFRAGLVDDNIVITLEDAAPTFDATVVPEPDLSIPPRYRRPGGMGVHLIRMATDGFDHRPRPGGGNILTLTRSLDPRPKEDR